MKIIGAQVKWHYESRHGRLEHGSGIVLAVEFETMAPSPDRPTMRHWKLLVESTDGLHEVYAEWVKEVLHDIGGGAFMRTTIVESDAKS